MIEAIAIVAQEGGSILPVSAQPGARKDAVLGERAGALRVAVTAPPDKGKANAAIQSLLAEALGCKSAQIALVSGATSRQKRFFISGLSTDELRRRLSERISQAGIPGVSRRDAEGPRDAEKTNRRIQDSKSKISNPG